MLERFRISTVVGPCAIGAVKCVALDALVLAYHALLAYERGDRTCEVAQGLDAPPDQPHARLRCSVGGRRDRLECALNHARRSCGPARHGPVPSSMAAERCGGPD